MIENRDFVHWEDVMSSTELDVEPKNPRVVTRPRPGHADLPGGMKYGARDLRNILERSSARETTARVAAGAVAKQLLGEFDIEIRSHVVKLGSVPESPLEKSWEEVTAIAYDSSLSCADDAIQAQMIAAIDKAKEDGDTLGGVFEVIVKGLPVGLGSAFSWNEKLDGRIAHAIMSIHAVKGVEIGDGIANAGRRGSDVHDEIFFEAGDSTQSSGFIRRTNRAGGLEGGITNGEELRVRGYLKPISTLKKPLRSVDINSKESSDAAYERSDVTVVPAAGVIGESMLAIVLANAMREKFGGDSLEEMKRNFDGYSTQIRNY